MVGILSPLASYRLHSKSETGHLKNMQLVQRLAHDYIFQVKQWMECDFMGKRSLNIFVLLLPVLHLKNSIMELNINSVLGKRRVRTIWNI